MTQKHVQHHDATDKYTEKSKKKRSLPIPKTALYNDIPINC